MCQLSLWQIGRRCVYWPIWSICLSCCYYYLCSWAAIWHTFLVQYRLICYQITRKMCTTVLVETRASLFYLQNTDVNSALHPSGIAESISSFGWGKGGNVTSAGWQVTLCDPMWHVSSRSGVATLRTAIHLLLTYLRPKLTPVFMARTYGP